MGCDAGAGFAVCRSNCERQAQPHLILTFSSFMTTANSHLATHSIQHPNPLPLHLERRPSQGPAQARRRTDSRAYPPSTSLLPRHTKGATVYSTVNSTAPLTSLRLLARFRHAMPQNEALSATMKNRAYVVRPRLTAPSPSTWSTTF